MVVAPEVPRSGPTSTRTLQPTNWKTLAISASVIVALIIGITLLFVGLSFGKPWAGSLVSNGHVCPLPKGRACTNFRHDFAIGSFAVALCYFCVSGILLHVIQVRNWVDEILWWLLTPFRLFVNLLSLVMQRIVFDVAILATLLILPMTIGSVLTGGIGNLSVSTRLESGFILVLSGTVCSVAVVLNWDELRRFKQTAMKELLAATAIGLIYIGRVWAGWTLEGIALAFALIAGVGALTSRTIS
jgi:hypothetical protein